MKNAKLLVAGALLLSGFFSGVVSQAAAPDESLAIVDLPFLMIGLFLLFFWYRLDSDERGYRRTPWMNVSVILLAVVAVPYYFFRTRGFAGGLGASVVFVIAGVAYSFLQYAGIYVAFASFQ